MLLLLSLDFCCLLSLLAQALGSLEDSSDLAAPQCVAGFGVRLDLHVIAPFLEFCVACSVNLSPQFWPFRTSSAFTAPQCVAGFRVRIYLQRQAPLFRTLLA